MAGGLRYKFTGSEIAVLTGFDAQSPSLAITAITKADPAVVTSSGHGLADGDVIKITGVSGMTEVNNGVFVVDVVDVNSFQLADTDSTGYGTYTSGGLFDVGAFSNFCELTGYNRTGGTSPEIPADSLCSTFAEFETGLPDMGTTQLDYNFAPRSAIQVAVTAFNASGERMAVKVVLPNDGGEMVQLGTVQQMSEQASRGGLWTASLTIRNTGPRFDVALA